jgi:hypothetical protein
VPPYLAIELKCVEIRRNVMNNTSMICRTVSIVKDYREEKRQGNNGEFLAKEIFFKVAVDRDYKVTRTENGKTISEYPTDFFLVKATGGLAETINKYATAKKEDGKLKSRLIALSGSFETYQKARKVTIDKTYQVNFNGTLYDIPIKDEVEVPDTPVIFVCDGIKFLDKNPEAQQGATVAQATPAPVVGTPVIAQASAPVAQAPVQAPTAPVVQGGYDPASGECPY